MKLLIISCLLFASALAQTEPLFQGCYKRILNGMPTNEGNEVGKTEGGSLLDCEVSCNSNYECKSFAYTGSWGGLCFLKDLVVTNNVPTHSDNDFSFFYQSNDCNFPKWYGVNKVQTVDFWGNMYGIGFSVQPQTEVRVKDALKKASDAGYNMIRTWETTDNEVPVLQYILDLGLDFKVQFGVSIMSQDSDNTAFAKVDKACQIAKSYPDLVLSFSLGNEQLGYYGMPASRIKDHAQYAKDSCGVPVTYNFAEVDWFWTYPGCMDLIDSLDYVNVHAYGHQFGHTPSPQSLFDTVKQQLQDRYDAFGKSKPMILGETGYQVHYNGHSEAEKGQYYSLIVKYVYGTSVNNRQARSMFYFELNNEDWKGNDDGWGVYSSGSSQYIGNPGPNFTPVKISEVLAQQDVLNPNRLIRQFNQTLAV